MKVLFAVSNEEISDAIIKQYQKDFKEIISYKNVYYFNAILKEIQKDKSYDRIVISEDLEPFANNNYDTIDRFLFEKLDSISDESSNGEGSGIPIILITTDRRSKGDAILLKLFSIGVYNALIGSDRNIEEVCKLINKPRTKKDSKIYYKIEADDANYQAENEENVNEAEIQNIITHYKKLGKNTERYVDSFNNIASQYTDQQLKVIIRFLPLNVKAVLEAESPKYQELMTFGENKKKRVISANPRSNYTPLGDIPDEPERKKKGLFEKHKKEVRFKAKKEPKVSDVNLDILESQNEEPQEGKNFIVPNAFSSKTVKKIRDEDIPNVKEDENEDLEMPRMIDEHEEKEETIDLFNIDDEIGNEEDEETSVEERIDNIVEEPIESESDDKDEDSVEIEEIAEEPKKRRGRPRKILSPEEQAELEAKQNAPKRKRGRPKKNQEELEQENIDLFDIANENDDQIENIEEDDDAIDLFNIENDDEKDSIIEEMEEIPDEEIYEGKEVDSSEGYTPINNFYPQQTNNMNNENISSLLTKDKKIVTFVGAPKNGTSFLINNLAAMFSENGINTAILDLTKNKNSYYIYTKNEENLRKIAYECMKKLNSGIAEGISVNKMLTVYTALPTNQNEENENVNTVLSTLASRHSLVLIDADFDTPEEYFAESQEIYLVQSMDILTIQPLTAFLRDLKSKGVLNPEKLRVVINKEVRVKGLNAKVLIGGMAYYNEPAMTFMTELFNKDKVKYCTIPFEPENYERYLETLVDCEVSIKGYTKVFLANLKALSNMVYPLLNKTNYGSIDDSYSKNNKKRFGI